jgi:hypothetical protein
MSNLKVTPSELQGGSEDVADLQIRCQVLAEYIVSTLNGMAGSAGHASLVSALNDAAAKGSRGYSGAWAAYRKAGVGLAGSAQAYSAAEQTIISQISKVTPGTFTRG